MGFDCVSMFVSYIVHITIHSFQFKGSCGLEVFNLKSSTNFEMTFIPQQEQQDC